MCHGRQLFCPFFHHKLLGCWFSFFYYILERCSRHASRLSGTASYRLTPVLCPSHSCFHPPHPSPASSLLPLPLLPPSMTQKISSLVHLLCVTCNLQSVAYSHLLSPLFPCLLFWSVLVRAPFILERITSLSAINPSWACHSILVVGGVERERGWRAGHTLTCGPPGAQIPACLQTGSGAIALMKWLHCRCVWWEVHISIFTFN